MVGGIGGEVVGGLASTTGIGAAVGVPAIVVSTGVVLGGAANVAAGARGLFTTGSGSGTGKPPPNPFGKKGGPAHQSKVAEVAEDVRARGLRPNFEHKVDTPGGDKGSRFVDVVGRDAEGNVVEMHQIGRATKGGLPVSREGKALDDIQKATGMRPEFHPYK
jgi:hypothetical protein